MVFNYNFNHISSIKCIISLLINLFIFLPPCFLLSFRTDWNHCSDVVFKSIVIPKILIVSDYFIYITKRKCHSINMIFYLYFENDLLFWCNLELDNVSLSLLNKNILIIYMYVAFKRVFVGRLSVNFPISMEFVYCMST